MIELIFERGEIHLKEVDEGITRIDDDRPFDLGVKIEKFTIDPGFQWEHSPLSIAFRADHLQLYAFVKKAGVPSSEFYERGVVVGIFRDVDRKYLLVDLALYA